MKHSSISQSLGILILMGVIGVAAVGAGVLLTSQTASPHQSSSSSISDIEVSSTITVQCCTTTITSQPAETFTTIRGSTFVIVNGSTEPVVCTILSEGNMIVTILNSSNGKPLGGLPVEITEITPTCGNMQATSTLGDLQTNASGVVAICCDVGSYNITVSYLGQSFFANTSVNPERATCVSMYIPSGKVNVNVSQTFENAC